MNYAKELAKAKNEVAYDNSTPPFTATQVTIGNPAASSVITFSVKTTVVQISTATGISGALGMIGKWGAGSVTTANFDLYVGGGASATFVIPVSIMGQSANAGPNPDNGLYASMSVRAAGSVGSASIIAVEY